MHILLTVLSVLGWVLLALLCLLLVALFTPARLVLELRYDKFSARLKVLCFTVTLYPRGQKQQGDAPDGKEAAPAAPPKAGAQAEQPLAEKRTKRQSKSAACQALAAWHKFVLPPGR